jgi:hypothetical protein
VFYYCRHICCFSFSVLCSRICSAFVLYLFLVLASKLTLVLSSLHVNKRLLDYYEEISIGEKHISRNLVKGLKDM